MALKAHCIFRQGASPIIAAAIHHGHDTRPEVDSLLKLSAEHRRREEDPYTGEWTRIATTQIVGLRSRFEVDLNRPRESAVYKIPDDAWGLDVWKKPPSEQLIRESLELYDWFYRDVELLLRELLADQQHLCVYDIHTYNHRRAGPTSAPACELENPDVNIGTGSIDRSAWGSVVDRFIADLRHCSYQGRHLDVRENVKFQGGHFGRWIHQKFPQQVVSIAIEFKKFFMDEWTGDVDFTGVAEIHRALQSTVPGVVEELAKL